MTVADIYNEIVEIKTMLAAHIAKGEAHEDKTRDLTEAIFGNGHPGLKTRVERIENERSFGLRARSLWIALGTACVGGISTIVIQKLIGH